MDKLKSISIRGVCLGFIATVATTIVLSLLTPLLFSSLLDSGEMDVLITSTGPLSYALLVWFVSIVVGVCVCDSLARSNEYINALLVAVVYALFSYWISTSPSNELAPYPEWYRTISYLILIPAALLGHWFSKKLSRRA